ncbi:MAG: hypothetical protein AB1505_36180 [Candidatus Latescibacterota bacterium]
MRVRGPMAIGRYLAFANTPGLLLRHMMAAKAEELGLRLPLRELSDFADQVRGEMEQVGRAMAAAYARHDRPASYHVRTVRRVVLELRELLLPDHRATGRPRRAVVDLLNLWGITVDETLFAQWTQRERRGQRG